jgi:hypothetical protein
MKLPGLILCVFIASIVVGCNRNPDLDSQDIVVERVVSEQVVEEPDSPPPALTSDFKTVHDWLVKVCDTEQPGDSIVTYRFVFLQSNEDYLVVLTGSKQYSEDLITIDFEPSLMYYLLPPDEYQSLPFREAQDRVDAELKAFMKTDKFRHSFFTKAKAITTNFSGEIWAR